MGHLTASARTGARAGFPALPIGALAFVALVLLTLVSPCYGSGAPFSFATSVQGFLAAFGLAEPLSGTGQTVYEWRLWRALTASGAGASLALAGAYLQGLFRNGLASPAVAGVTADGKRMWGVWACRAT